MWTAMLRKVKRTQPMTMTTINPIHFASQVNKQFLDYQLTAFPLTDPDLAAQARAMLRGMLGRSPLIQGPYVSLSKAFLHGRDLVSWHAKALYIQPYQDWLLIQCSSPTSMRPCVRSAPRSTASLPLERAQARPKPSSIPSSITACACVMPTRLMGLLRYWSIP